MTTIATIHPVAAATAATVQAKDDTRYYLNGILIQAREAGGVIAVGCDGHRMISAIDREGSVEGESLIAKIDSTVITKCRNRKAESLELRSDGVAVVHFSDGQFVGGWERRQIPRLADGDAQSFTGTRSN